MAKVTFYFDRHSVDKADERLENLIDEADIVFLEQGWHDDRERVIDIWEAISEGSLKAEDVFTNDFPYKGHILMVGESLYGKMKGIEVEDSPMCLSDHRTINNLESEAKRLYATGDEDGACGKIREWYSLRGASVIRARDMSMASQLEKMASKNAGKRILVWLGRDHENAKRLLEERGVGCDAIFGQGSDKTIYDDVLLKVAYEGHAPSRKELLSVMEYMNGGKEKPIYPSSG